MSAAVGRRPARRFVVLRGYPGVGKTEVLREIAALGAPTLDLEAIAGHRGSAFGGVGMPAQPDRHKFSARVDAFLRGDQHTGPAFLEAEGAALGRLALPAALRQALDAADYILLRDATRRRIARIVATYRDQPRAAIAETISRLEKRLGERTVDRAQTALHDGNLEKVAALLLPYYERIYSRQMAQSSGLLLAAIDIVEQRAAEIALHALCIGKRAAPRAGVRVSG